MPSLTLTILRCPEYGSADERRVTGSLLTVGRDRECDWQLPDPFKSLSRKHFQLECVAGAWQVRDLSSNGTFLNASATPIGRDNVQPLRAGDKLQLGDYDIGVSFEQEAAFSFDDAVALPTSPRFGDARLPGLDDSVSPGMAPPPVPGHLPLHAFGAMPDHAPAGAQAFVPGPPAAAPPAARPIVPDDWYQALAPAQPSAPPPVVPPAISPTPLAAGSPLTDLPPAPLPEPLRELPAPDAAAAGHTANVPPLRGVGTGVGVAAFLAGSAMSPDAASRLCADPEATLHKAGQLLAASVAGMRGLLIARGSVKREFRIEQTMLRTRENNPLKFAATDEQALVALLDPKAPALTALQEAIDDLTRHQIAVLAATQAAARALLERLDPAKLQAEDKGGGFLPNTTEKRLWEAYKRQHAQLVEQFEDDFDSAFGKAFARAYEHAVKGGRE
jgi:type VI secretion system protein ImpI/type VI secretion system protein